MAVLGTEGPPDGVLMRSARLTLGVAAVVVALAGVTTAAVRRADVEPLKPPAIGYEQTKTAITVRIHNPNRHWGLRNQRVLIQLFEQRSHPFNWFGPDTFSGTEEFPELGDIRCCLITELRPGADYEFMLPPSARFTVNAVTIDMKGPPGWVRM